MNFIYEKANRKKKNQFVQEQLYIEEYPMEPIPVDPRENKEKEERGIVIIQL